MDTADDSATLSAAESLAVIERQRAQVGKQLDVNPVVLYTIWGTTWVLGFGALALSTSGTIRIPDWVAGLTFGVLLVLAMVLTGWHIARATRGIRGTSAQTGAMYGWTWALGFLAMGAINTGLVRMGLTDEQTALLWPATSLLIVGVLYLASGAMWRDWLQFGLGAWVLVTDAVSVFAGVPGNNVVLAVAGGGGFLVAAAGFALQRRRCAP